MQVDLKEVLYEKCRDCHLFVEPNVAYDDAPGTAEYMHLARGNAIDERLDADHEPRPSSMKANLATWRVFGPLAMRERFVNEVPE